MAKEIERKYTIDPKLTINEISNIINSYPHTHHIIKEHYFNDTTRLRMYDDSWYITVKSLDMFIRDEFEFEIKKNIDFIPTPLMVKDRYCIEYCNHVFEVNIFANLKDKNNRNIIIVEVELDNENDHIELPSWIDHDVTHHPAFYGFNLFKKFRDDYNNRVNK